MSICSALPLNWWNLFIWEISNGHTLARQLNMADKTKLEERMDRILRKGSVDVLQIDY